MWILIGVLLGSIVSSQHDTREACEGRAVILREKGARVKCEAMNTGTGTTIQGLTTVPHYTIIPNN